MKNRDGKILRQDQVAYRNSILRENLKDKQVKIKSVYVPPVIDPEQYLDNCIFWVKEYREGRTTRERYSKVIESMKQHCETILKTK